MKMKDVRDKMAKGEEIMLILLDTHSVLTYDNVDEVPASLDEMFVKGIRAGNGANSLAIGSDMGLHIEILLTLEE